MVTSRYKFLIWIRCSNQVFGHVLWKHLRAMYHLVFSRVGWGASQEGIRINQVFQ